MNNDLVIRKLTFDLKINNEKNFFEISNELSNSINKSFFKSLESGFLEFKDENLVIKEIIIDLGVINSTDFNLIGELINDELKKKIVLKEKTKLKKRSLEDFFFNYLNNGYLPWWAPNKEKANDFISQHIITQKDYNYIKILLFKNFSNYIKVRRLTNKENLQFLLNKCFFESDNVSNYFFELEKKIEERIKKLFNSPKKKAFYSKTSLNKDFKKLSDFNTLGAKSKNEIGFEIIKLLLNQKYKSKNETLRKLKSIENRIIKPNDDFIDYTFNELTENSNKNNLYQIENLINHEGRSVKSELEEKKIYQLLQIAKNLGIKKTKGLKKIDLIKIISKHSETSKLKEKKTYQLLQIAKDLGIKKIKSLKKADLIKKISEHRKSYLDKILKTSKDNNENIYNTQKNYREFNFTDTNKKIFNGIEESKFFKNISLLIQYIDPKSILIKKNIKYNFNEINQIERFLLKLNKKDRNAIIKNIKEVIINKSKFENFIKISSYSMNFLLYISKLTLTIDLNIKFREILKLFNQRLEYFESRFTQIIYKHNISGLSKKIFQLKVRYMILSLFGRIKKNESIKYDEISSIFLIENQQFFRLKFEKIFKFVKIKKSDNFFENQIKKTFKVLIESNEFSINSKKIKTDLFFKDLIFHLLKTGKIPKWSKRIKIENEEILRFLKILIKKKDFVYLNKFINDKKVYNNIKSILPKSDYLKISKLPIDLNIKIKNKGFDDFEVFKYYIEIGSIPLEKFDINPSSLIDVIKKNFNSNYFLLKKHVHKLSKNDIKIKRMLEIFEESKDIDMLFMIIGKTLLKTIKSFTDFFINVDKDLKGYFVDLKSKKFISTVLEIWSKEELFCDEKIISILVMDKTINFSKWINKERLNKIKKADKKRFDEIFDFTLNFLELKSKIKNEKLNEFNDFEVTIEKDIYEGINVDNCGLIIIWPFVSKLIEKLELTSQNYYIDDVSKTKALLATNYLINGNSKLINTELTLNKILCGIELDFEFNEKTELNDYEINLCNMALEAVIKQWKKIKSVRNLRDWFLKRNGVLIEKDLEYNLIVEKKSQDLLLKFVPWGFLLVKSKIMKKKILVNWKF